MYVNETLGTLTIASGQTTSTKLSDILSAGQLKTALGALEQLSIRSPAALTGAVTVEVALEEPGTTFEPLNDPSGSDITLAAGEVKVIPYVTFKDIQLVSSLAEGAARSFVLVGKLRVA